MSETVISTNPAEMLTPENIAAIKAQMKGPVPPAFILALPMEQQTELKVWVQSLLSRPSPADMFAKVADGMITAGLKEAQEFEKFVAEQALPDIRSALDRIENAQLAALMGSDMVELLREAKSGKWTRIDAILAAVDGK